METRLEELRKQSEESKLNTEKLQHEVKELIESAIPQMARINQTNINELSDKLSARTKNLELKLSAIEQMKQVEQERKLAEATIEGSVFIVTQGGDNVRLGLTRIDLIPYEQIKQYLNANSGRFTADLSKELASIRENKLAIERLNKEKMDYLSKRELESIRLFGTAPDLVEKEFKDRQEKRREEEAKSEEERPKSAKVNNRNQLISLGDTLSQTFYRGLPKATNTVLADSDGKFRMTVPAKDKIVLIAKGERQVGRSKEIYHWVIPVVPKAGETLSIVFSNNNLMISDSDSRLEDIFRLRD